LPPPSRATQKVVVGHDTSTRGWVLVRLVGLLQCAPAADVVDVVVDDLGAEVVAVVVVVVLEAPVVAVEVAPPQAASTRARRTTAPGAPWRPARAS